MIVVCLAGQTCAGKDVTADFLGEYGFKKMSLSEILKKMAVERGIPTDAESLFKLSESFKEKLGEGFLGKMVLDEFKKRGWEKSCAVGLRRWDEWEELRRVERSFLIYVNAPLKLCFERMLKRKRAGDKNSWEEFVRYEKKLSSIGLDKLKKNADFIIDNSGSLKELKEMVRTISQYLY